MERGYQSNANAHWPLREESLGAFWFTAKQANMHDAHYPAILLDEERARREKAETLAPPGPG